jgi:hypothetical protein
MDRFGIGNFSSGQNGWNFQITFFAGRGTDANRFVGKFYVKGILSAVE